MSLEVIYVTRHGFRPPFVVDPSKGTYSTAIRSPTGIPTDPPLTSYGVEQAEQLASHLLNVDPPIDQVYSSPYYRCLQTISPFVARRNETSRDDGELSPPASASEAPVFGIRAEQGLGEWFGLAPFEHPTSAPLSELQGYFPKIDANYASRVTTPRHGESLPQLHNRVAAAMDAIIKRSDQDGHKAVIVCSHAAVIIAIGRVLTGTVPKSVDEDDFSAFTCGLSIYRRRRGGVGKAAAPLTADGDQGTLAKGHEADGSAASMRSAAGSAGTESAGLVDPLLPEVHESVAELSWRDGVGVGGGWSCEMNSGCSFLRGGEERGWRFSGDESFSTVDPGGFSNIDAGLGGTSDERSLERSGDQHKLVADNPKL